MKNFILGFIIFIAFFLQACSPTTSLLKITDEYKLAKPEKTKLLLKYDLPAVDFPIIKIKVSKEHLSQKIYTKHYETLRSDKKSGQVALGALITAASAGLIFIGTQPTTKDSLRKVYYVIGAIGGIYGLIKMAGAPTPKEFWTEDSVDFNDTLYSSPEVMKTESLTLQNTHDSKSNYLITDNEGILSADVRDFYDNIDKDSSMKILVSDGVSQPAYVDLPSSYIKKIQRNELESKKLLTLAEEKVKERKFTEANRLFGKVVAEYPFTKFIEKSKTAMENIEGDIKEEKLEAVRKFFRLVSANKVPEAFNNAGITSSELTEIASSIERMSRSSINMVIVDGLGMALDRYQAENEFSSLNNPQKIYVILAASENISKKQGTQQLEMLSAILGIDENIAKKFARIKSGALLGN